ncbi:MAG: hypothetical protein FJW26_03505 [Acidimicrobiia bacterium]|nr:hypothetical protein [Acidimicrobiia bacterium]
MAVWNFLVSFVLLALVGLAGDQGVRLPWLDRILPLGGRAGSQVTVSLAGDMLSNSQGIEFDCADLEFQLRKAGPGQIEGVVRIAAGAAPGPHLFRAKTADGYTNALMFTVGQLPTIDEVEPNESIQTSQPVTLPSEIYGSLQKVDLDSYSFQVKAGERWRFEVRAAQYGSTFESQLYLRDASGKELAFNDDRGDFDVNSAIDYTFAKAGTYYVQVDVFRNVRGWEFTKNCGYVLRISRLPQIVHLSRLGARARSRVKVRLAGVSFDGLERVFLYPTRRAEYFTLTIPWTMPVRFEEDDPVFAKAPRVEAKILQALPGAIELEVPVPNEPLGAWSIVVETKSGVSDPVLFEVGQADEVPEVEPNDASTSPQKLRFDGQALVVEGHLDQRNVSELIQDIDNYLIAVKKGVPLQLFTLASQLLAPRTDTVLRLFAENGGLLAESDDLIAGRGFFMGSADSNLYYVPDRDRQLRISVFDRLGRGGADYRYRLHVRSEEPGFRLIVSPQFGLRSVSLSNFTAVRGSEAKLLVSFIRMPPKTHPDDPAAKALAPPAGASMEGEVRVWVEGLPEGISAGPLRFRADEMTEPGGDGVTMAVPERVLTLRVPESIAPGNYPFRVMGEVVGREHLRTEARAFETIGGLMGAYNYFHRPAAGTALTVVDHKVVTLELKQERIQIAQGGSSVIDLSNRLRKVEGQQPSIQLLNVPEGLSYEPSCSASGEVSIRLRASIQLPAKPIADVYVEAVQGPYKVSSRPFVVSVVPKQEGH